jgi:hypothetical protein
MVQSRMRASDAAMGRIASISPGRLRNGRHLGQGLRLLQSADLLESDAANAQGFILWMY